MDFRFANLMGAPYRGGNLLIAGSELLSPVGNRVSQIDLTSSISTTLPFEALKQIRLLCLSPDGALLLAIDEDGRSLLINRRRRVLLHHFSFKGPVRAARFSPDGQYIACAVGKILQIWRTPGFVKTTAPMQLHRQYGGCHADITALDWSQDGRWVAVVSKDLAARVYSLHALEGYRVPTLAGHKDTPVGVFFMHRSGASDIRLDGTSAADILTVSRDGALFTWEFQAASPDGSEQLGSASAADEQHRSAAAAEDGIADGRPEMSASAQPTKRQKLHAQPGKDFAAEGRWRLKEKHFFNQRGAHLTALDYHKPTNMLVVAFSSGIFDLYQLPAFENMHMLSMSRQSINAASFSPQGNWIALGCAALGQLLVWEWRSESYVLKQQGHHYDVSTVAFSPDGAYIATGADDNKVKLWTVNSGFCFVTFSEHTAPVTAVSFLPTSSAAVSASLDGTVRAWDLLRYRNFRTMTTPDPVQLASLAVDPAGEVICAGSLDTFQIFVWATKTGRLLDVLAAHEAPVVALAFSPAQPLLASGSWDKTVRTWDVFSGKGGVEVLQHTHDVLALAWAPSGKMLASATLDGQIYLWDPLEAELLGTIEGRRDIAGGRLSSDRRSANNRTSGQCFTSLAFSADGSFLLAAGASKYVCLYDVEDKMLLRRVQISSNRSLDGVLDQLNSKDMTDAGPAQLLADAASDEDELLPPTTAGGPSGVGDLPGTGGGRRPQVRSRAVALSPTGQSWAAATTEGLLLYSLEKGATFDPTNLTEGITPQAAKQALKRQLYLRALLIALRLKDTSLQREVVLAAPASEVDITVAALPTAAVADVLALLAEYLPVCPHLEFILKWLQALCLKHGPAIQKVPTSVTMPVFRLLQQSLTNMHDSLASTCDANLYTLRYLSMIGKARHPLKQLPSSQEEGVAEE